MKLQSCFSLAKACSIPNSIFVAFLQVSWIRSKDSYMLYIGDVKFVDDDRFELLPGNGYGDWTLRFRLIREADAGKYECQISTSPKLSQTFTLNVVGTYFHCLDKDSGASDY